jgi:hypothetical protein
MTDSKAEHESRGDHHQAQAPTSWWTIVWVLASWVAIGMTLYAVNAQRQNARKLLQTQIAVELDKQFDSAEMRRARRSLAAQLLAKNGEVSDYRVFDFFEKIAAYDAEDRIDDETVYDEFSYYTVRYWLASQDTIKSYRKEEGDDAYYHRFEELSGRMLSHEAEVHKKKVADITPSASKIESFLRDEAALPD